MKQLFTVVVAVALGLAVFSPKQTKAQDVEGQITISGAFALYPLAVKWAEEYKKLHPKVRIDISAGGAGKGMTDVLSNLVDVAMVSRDVNEEETKKGAIGYSVAKDAVVAVVSAKHPALKDLLAKGLKKDLATEVWINGTHKTWNDGFGISLKAPLHLYTRSDACGAGEVWAKFFGKKQEDLLGSGVFGDPGLALAVKNDALGIGYNNIGYAYDSKTKKQVDGIRVLPIDLNNNGKIDADENFYNTIDDLVDAIAAGKYPSPPARNLYFVSNGKVKNAAAKAFIQWTLTEGQKYVGEAGFVNLSKDVLKKEAAKL